MKLAAIVIVYYPDLNDLKKNILRYIDDVDILLLWDNTPNSDCSPLKIDLPGYDKKIIRLSTGKNEYIAYPLNQAIDWCRNNQYTHLMSMDQDSLFEEGCFKAYKKKVNLNLGMKNAIFGVNPNNQFPFQDSLLKVNWFITSGSIYDVNVIQSIGGFREDYEIDCVDNEICYKANANGYNTLVDTHCILNQIYGTPARSIFGFTTSGYSPFRTYSILCNHILLWKEYPFELSKELKKKIIKDYFLYRFVKILLSEKRKSTKLLALFYALIDGLQGKRVRRFF
jgi:rhamnosyltransferase